MTHLFLPNSLSVFQLFFLLLYYGDIFPRLLTSFFPFSNLFFFFHFFPHIFSSFHAIRFQKRDRFSFQGPKINLLSYVEIRLNLYDPNQEFPWLHLVFQTSSYTSIPYNSFLLWTGFTISSTTLRTFFNSSVQFYLFIHLFTFI